jgi:hypothetical protein
LVELSERILQAQNRDVQKLGMRQLEKRYEPPHCAQSLHNAGAAAVM